MKKILPISAIFLPLFFFACKNIKVAEKNNIISDSVGYGISGKLSIFHAGSLSISLKEIVNEFKKEEPNVDIQTESAGSVDCARKITELNRPCDIIATSDYKIINDLLIPDFTEWNILFATNEMCIAFNEKSRYNEKINQDNWFEILMKEEVIYSRSDPNSDPCGYRTIFTIKLAEKFYKITGLAEKLLNKDLRYIRPKEVDLLALLESNTIDYIFIYRSIAHQHKLKYIVLPEEINLKNKEYSDYYSQVSVEITGEKPGELIIVKGEPIIYGICILKNAPNEALAEKFLSYFLTKEKGMAIMDKNGQEPLIPALSVNYDSIPDSLKSFLFRK